LKDVEIVAEITPLPSGEMTMHETGIMT
jgi:hypothetical protein